MARTLYLDATRGLTAEALLAAVVDLGVAPSPLLFATGSLGFPGGLEFERTPHGTTTWVLPATGPVPRLTAAEALEALRGARFPEPAVAHAQGILAHLRDAHPEREPRFLAHAEADSLLVLAALSLALAQLAPETALASRIEVGDDEGALTSPAVVLLASVAEVLTFDLGAGPRVSPGGAATALHLADDRVGLPEPEWRGYVARGRGLLRPGLEDAVAIALGDAP